MPSAPLSRRHRLRTDLRHIFIDGVLFSIMVGVGESFFGAFVLDLGLSAVAAGLIVTLPLLIASVAQLGVPFLVRKSGRYRLWFVIGATIQAAGFIPLICIALLAPFIRAIGPPLLTQLQLGSGWQPSLAALLAVTPAVAVFLVATVYWGGAIAGGPPWTALVGLIIPRRVRPRYFALRNRACQAGVLIGLLTGGAIIAFFERWEARLAAADALPGWVDVSLLGFICVFAVGFICRVYSTRRLARYSEPRPLPFRERRVSVKSFAARLHNGHDGRLVLYAIAVSITAQIAQPFFVPYMREQLQVSGTWLSLLLAGAFLGKMLALPLAGSVAHRHGPRAALWIGGVGIIPLSGLWLFTSDPYALLGLQMLSGAIWGFYELGLFLLWYDALRDNERTGVLALFNFFNSGAIAAGSLIGGRVLHLQGAGAAAYELIFVISIVARAATLPLLFRVHREPPRAESVEAQPVAVRAGGGSLDEPILKSE